MRLDAVFEPLLPSTPEEESRLETAALRRLLQVKLERVLGLTVTSSAALDCDPCSGLVAYPAG